MTEFVNLGDRRSSRRDDVEAARVQLCAHCAAFTVGLNGRLCLACESVRCARLRRNRPKRVDA